MQRISILHVHWNIHQILTQYIFSFPRSFKKNYKWSSPVKEKGLASFILTSISSPNEKLKLMSLGISTKVNLFVLVLPMIWEEFFGLKPSIKTLSILLIYLWFLLLAVFSTKSLIFCNLAFFTSSESWFAQTAAGVFGLGAVSYTHLRAHETG